MSRRARGFLRSCLVPGVAALVAGAALVFQAPQLVTAVAHGCVTPGKDGPNAALTGVVNTYYPATASAAAGATTISVGPRIAGVSPAIAAGDLLLVIQTQDADIQGTNAVTYGDGATGHGSTALRSTGLYEYVSSASAVVAGVVTIAGSGAGNGLVNSYDFSAAVTATHGFRTFQVVRVPQYSSATLGAGLSAAPWNGALHAGGVLAIDVAGALNLNAQTISVDQLGFKGALGVAQAGGPDAGTDYVVASQRGDHGYKAEGVAGTPHFLYDAIANAQVTGAADGYPSGDAARGAPGTAGGGGTDSHPVANDQNSGGGGGANGGQGGMGGNSWNANLPVGGLGGAAFPGAVTRLVLGGGGGAGTRNNSATFASSGGTGGGVVMIRTGSLAGAGTISANGGVGFTPVNDGGGGGGAGGSVVVTTNTGTVNGLTIRANGGNGTNAWPTGATGAANYHGPGGGGGGGVIITSNALPPAQTSVLGGVHGTTTVDAATYGSVSGAAGLVLTTTPAAIPGSSSGAECLPALTVTKTTSTPNVTNTVAGTTATYSITVSNAVNTAAATSVSISDALPAGFSYASTGSVVLNAGATRPATVNPAPGDTVPAFGTFTIPASGSVVITFTVNVAASVAPGTYNNPATATYLDPTRITVVGTTSAGYAGGGAERVTVHAPDMTIAKSHVDPLARGSTTSTYTLTATNSGNVASSGTVTVTDTLPAGLTPTAAAGAGWTCPAPVGQTVTCTRSDALAAGSSYPPITVTVTVLQSAPNSVTNTASVSGGGQTNTTNGTASDVTNIVSRADIAVTKTVNNANPNQGASVIFTVTTTNNGPSNATGVVVTDLLPAGLTFVSAVPSAGTSYVSGTGVWTIGALANGANATLAITATVTGNTAVTNTATKTAETETDPVAGNDSASATVTGQSADIAITKTVSNATPNFGTNVTFTVTATNNGPSTATGVVVTDLLPAGLVFVSATPSGVTTYNSGTGVWTIGTLTNGANATLSIVATVNTTIATANTATKTAEDQPDPVAGNNSASATVTGQAADIAVTKTVSNPTPNFGANGIFTVTATNNGPSAATGVVVTDLLPAGLTFVSAAPSAGTSYVSGTGVWTIGTLANGANATVAITATVNTSAVTTNTATKTAENQPDPVAGNNSASATITPVAADIAVTKAVDNTRPNLNTNVTFTITAPNNGPSNATGVVVTDLLPAGLTFVSATPSGATTYNSGTGVWTIGGLANGANATLSIVATDTSTSAITNTATKTAETEPDPVAGNNTASVTVTGQSADIAVTKVVDNATPNLNSNVTFTITAHNNGPSNATGVQVSDTLPAGLTFVSSTPSAGTTYNSGTGIWNIGALANGANATLSIVATVTSTAPVTNTATKTAEDQPDPVAGNNSASATVTPVWADIAVTKTVDNSTPAKNSNVTFTITAVNNGPSNATGVQVTDLLPTSVLKFVSATPSGTTTYDPVTGIWNIGALANGSTATLTIVATVKTSGSATNTATVTAEDQVDPVTGNNSASSTVACCIADIAVTKTVNNATPNLGTNVVFTITATDNGPSAATGLQLTDQLPAGLTFVSSAPSVGTYNSGTGVWDIGSGLTNGASATLGITATVNTLAVTTNTATKTAEVEADRTARDDTASVTIRPVAADIAVTKTVSNTAPNQNTNVTFTITATNNGPSNATGVQVTDLLPAGLTFVSATPSGATTYTPGTGVWDIGALANGANSTLSIVAKVTGTTSVTNTATKTAAAQPDPVPGNNTASATVTGQAADIALTKIVDNATPNLGSNVTFTVTATNNGPSNATGVEVTDTLPAGLTFVSATPSGATTYNSGTGVWNIGALANGASATLGITATVNTTTATTNTASKTAEDQPDPVAGNNSASAVVTGQAADIAIAKTVSNTVPNQNTNVTFTITATNNGPSNATGVQVTDLLPAGLTFVSAVPSVGTYSSGIWNIGALANGSNATLSITATVTGTTAVTNTATKTAENLPDPVAGNDSASATVTGQAADIAILKTVSNPTPDFGTNVTFTVTATNNGPSNATGVQVTDLLPAGLTFVSAVPSVGTSYNSGSGIWNIGGLANTSSATLAITATVNTTAADTNTATKTAENQPDPAAGNNSASATITPVAADIALTKTVSNTAPNQNINVTFTITATNNGPSNATGVQVTDLLPGGLTFVSAVPSAAYNSGTGVWTIGALANGANATLSIVATVTGNTAVTNTATKSAEVQPDPVAGNNTASATVTGQGADIAILKTVSNPTPNLGSNVTFTITAHNNGPSNATGVQVTDSLPAGLTFVSAVPSVGTTYNSGSGIWDIGALGNGANATLSITATVNTTATATNTATRTAGNQPDPVPGNNSAGATINPVAADIAIAKSVDNPTPNLNTNVTFTVTANNNGPSDATGVKVTDVLPGTLTFVSSAATVGAYDSITGVWSIGALANGANATLSITVTVTGLANSTNTATKTAEDQIDPVTSNDSASSKVACCLADIAVTKTVDNPTPNFGANVIYTVTAKNNGPLSASGLQLTDKLPAGLTFVSAAGAGSYDPVTGVWIIGGLANASSTTLTITATVNTLAPTTNTATKTAENEADNTAGDDSASATITPVAADIAITKTVSNTVPNQNTNVTFTITATNNGPSNATGVLVTDLLPAGLTLVSATPSGATTYDSVTGVWTIGALANGANATLSLVAKVTGTTPVTNTATKTAEVQSDQVAGNNTATATVTGQAADIAILKTVSNPTPSLGSNVTFTVTATNNGPSDATGVQVTDSLPAGLTFGLALPSVGIYNSGTGVWNIGALANGANATLSIVATVNTVAATTNTASKTAEDQPDPAAGNNSASATITPVAADIAIAKTVSNTTPNQNTNVTFTITATNNGPSNATGVQVTDLLPAGLTFVSAVPSVGTYTSGTGVWDIGPLANGANGTLSIVATVTGTSPVTNTATKTAELQPDPVAGNNTASATVTGQGADIAIAKTVTSPTVALGSNVIFVVTATNNGPSDATGVQVTDSLPAGLTLVSATPSAGTTYNPGTGLWNIGALTSGAQATLSIVARVTVTTPATNTATKTAENQTDPVPGDDSASATVTGVSADIAVTKTVNLSTPNVGQNVTYTLVAHNLGPSTATGVQLSDLLPAGVTYVSYTATQGAFNAATGIWNVGTMVNGSTVTLSVVVRVTASGTIVNTVTAVPGNYFDPNLSNNTASASFDPGLPGLPNTSAPDGTAGVPRPAAPQRITGLLLTILAVVAGLGMLGLAGIGRRRNRARFGQRRSRSRQRQSQGRLAIGVLAVLLSLALASLSVGELASYPSATVAGLAPGTQLIGSKVVAMAPPAAPKAETFHPVAGAITPSRLRIPSIGVDAWIGPVGLRSDGSMDVPNNLWTSSWLATGPRPGQAGNAVIAGHRGVGSPALFSHLENLRPGDSIYVSDAAGNEVIYVVTRVASLDLSASTQVAVFGPTTAQQLVLITCFGQYMDSARTYDHRLVVFSRPLPLAS